MGQHAHDAREPMRLENVEKLKRLHLKAKARVHQQQDQVHNLRRIKKTRSPRAAPGHAHGLRSLTLPMSSIVFRSGAHSKNVSRRCLPLTTVMGPVVSLSLSFVYRFTSDLAPRRRNNSV